MSSSDFSRGRRRFVRLAVAGVVAAPATGALRSGDAAAADLVSESDPRAVAVKYRKDATQSAERKDGTAICDNCTLYTGKPMEASGTCEIFGGGLVAAKGWCTSWEGY